MTEQNMKQDDHTLGAPSDIEEISDTDPQPARPGRKESGNAKSSTQRGAAADKALLEAGGTIVSRLRLRPIAARALAILMDREGQEHGAQRAAIERALIDAAGGAEVLEKLAAEEAAAEARAIEQASRPRLSSIETELVALLESKGPIRGTAEIGHALWPDRDIQPQGAAIAAGGILRRLLDRAYIEFALVDNRRVYSVTQSGKAAREQDRLDTIDSRQLTLLEN